MSYFDSHLEEVIVGSAEFMQLDSAGRILIPNHLRERAVIKRDVLLFVMSGRMRIWDEERWEQRNQVMEARLQDEEFSQQWRNLKHIEHLPVMCEAATDALLVGGGGVFVDATFGGGGHSKAILRKIPAILP